MALGRLTTDWKQLSRSQAMTALSQCQPAFQYFMKTNGTAWETTKMNLEADYLVSCDRDFMSAVPPEAKFKAYKKGKIEALGFVTVNPSSNELSLYDALSETTAAVQVSPLLVNFGGREYTRLGGHGSNVVYAHLDRTAIRALNAASRLTDADLTIFENSMKKGIIPPKSTGSDGVKYESQGPLWVIKITISMGNANQIDNTLSPAATETHDPGAKRLYLNFNQLVLRH